ATDSAHRSRRRSPYHRTTASDPLRAVSSRTIPHPVLPSFFSFNDPTPTEIYTLSLHDALPISARAAAAPPCRSARPPPCRRACRSEEHTSELQSRENLVCRLLLEKKNNKKRTSSTPASPELRRRLSQPPTPVDARSESIYPYI